MAQVLNDRAGNAVQAAATGMNAARVAQTILNSGVQDRQGRFVFGAEYVARWGGYSWALSASPYAASEGKLSRFRATYEWEIEPKLALGADGIYLDSVSNWCHLPNYRREHLERSRHPLTFTCLDPAPAQLGVWHHYEFIEYLSNDLHRRGRLLMANIFPYEWVFFNHRLDVMGHEVWGANDLEKRRAQRTLAYHKPYTWLMQQGDAGAAADREKWMQQAMLYGIAPNVVGGAPQAARYEKWRPLYKTYMPVIIALGEAGWEPVTHAAVEPGAVLLERFGPKDGTLFLTACNPGTQALTVTITVDAAALGFTSPAKAVRLPGGRELAVVANRFQDTLEPGVTCGYRLGQ